MGHLGRPVGLTAHQGRRGARLVRRDRRGHGQLPPWGVKPLINPDSRTLGEQAVRQLFVAYVGPK
jgi:hypothetical protein